MSTEDIGGPISLIGVSAGQEEAAYRAYIDVQNRKSEALNGFSDSEGVSLSFGNGDVSRTSPQEEPTRRRSGFARAIGMLFGLGE